jgi:DNA-binding NtrC family response regulator
MQQKILVIDDEKAIRSSLKDILSFEGFDVEEATDGIEAIKKIKDNEYDCILCDIKMPKMDGKEVLDQSLQLKPDIPFILISGHGTIDAAVEAVKKGAYDFIAKPPDLNRLLITIRNAIDRNSLIIETKQLRKKVDKISQSDMIGLSPALVKIKETIEKVAPTDFSK